MGKINSILKQRFSNFAVITVLVTALSLDGLTSAIKAQQLSPASLQQVNGGLFRSSSQDFFEEGDRRVEREIELLTHSRFTPAEDILRVPACDTDKDRYIKIKQFQRLNRRC